jgi:hypothetical protein
VIESHAAPDESRNALFKVLFLDDGVDSNMISKISAPKKYRLGRLMVKITTVPNAGGDVGSNPARDIRSCESSSSFSFDVDIKMISSKCHLFNINGDR